MKLTKLEHAGMTLEKLTSRLIIDPGKFTTPLTEVSGTVAVVVTHEHDDHWTPEQLARVAERNRDLRVFAPAGAAERILATDVVSKAHIEPVQAGDAVEVGPFTLRFYGGVHAEIHRSLPRVDNVGVVVNDTFAYSGDAYDLPPGPDGEPLEVETLAVPTYGPWMRIADSLDFIESVRPRRVLGVHEMLLSKAGKELARTRLAAAVEAVGGAYLELAPYDSVEVPG